MCHPLSTDNSRKPLQTISNPDGLLQKRYIEMIHNLKFHTIKAKAFHGCSHEGGLEIQYDVPNHATQPTIPHTPGPTTGPPTPSIPGPSTAPPPSPSSRPEKLRKVCKSAGDRPKPSFLSRDGGSSVASALQEASGLQAELRQRQRAPKRRRHRRHSPERQESTRARRSPSCLLLRSL